MLRYVYANDLNRFPRLADSMFRDRAEQFSTRLGWAVSVDENGWERDEYDAMNPLYVIWELPDGTHGGSMRFLPTSGPTMVRDHFAPLLEGLVIESPLIWECTRFCISPRADRRAAAGLVLGAGELMAKFGLDHFCGIFDPRMERIYRMYRVQPDVLASMGEGKERISLGLWEMQPEAWDPVLRMLGIDHATSLRWLELSFGTSPLPPMARSA